MQQARGAADQSAAPGDQTSATSAVPSPSPKSEDERHNAKRRRQSSGDTDPMWIREFGLRASDRELVRTGWLNDKIVDAVNWLISRQLGSIHQTTVLSQTAKGFDAIAADGVMILHGNNHWVTVANINNTVTYFDSLRPHQLMSAYIARQLIQLFPQHVGTDGKLPVLIAPSTPQTNSSDCGVFAAAYSAELVNGNVSGVQAPFACSQMRAHLEKCLQAKELTPFPHDPHQQQWAWTTSQGHQACSRRRWCRLRAMRQRLLASLRVKVDVDFVR